MSKEITFKIWELLVLIFVVLTIDSMFEISKELSVWWMWGLAVIFSLAVGIFMSNRIDPPSDSK